MKKKTIVFKVLQKCKTYRNLSHNFNIDAKKSKLEKYNESAAGQKSALIG